MGAQVAFFALVGLAFYGFIIWAVIEHVKEMRKQSETMAKIASLLEGREDRN